jgi:hypothetical protein
LHGVAQQFALTGAGAGVDSAWEQKKLEARKMLENAATPTRRVHQRMMEIIIFHERTEPVLRTLCWVALELKVILPSTNCGEQF